MATSPIYNWPEPDNTDLVKNGALAMRTLGDAIDTTMATMTPKSIVDAKGDLIAASAADTPARLAVGANGETLVADSSTATGLRYQPTFAAGKNAVINGAFNVWQRGTSFAISANAAYGPDRFFCDSGSLNYTFSRQAFTAGTAPVAGYEGQYFLRAAATSGSGGFPKIYQKIEDVRTFAGQTVTLSFWIKASANTTAPNFQFVQYFGTGGSPSSTWFSSIQGIAVTTSWQRVSYTVALPSFAGSTVGTNNDGWLGVYLNLPNSGTLSIDTWGWQLEAGSVATAFQTATGTIQGELAACQRYYFRTSTGTGGSVLGNGYTATTTVAYASVQYPVVMRTTPTTADFVDLRIEDQTGTALGISAITFSNPSAFMARLGVTISGATAGRFCQLQTGSTSGYVGFSAEL